MCRPPGRPGHDRRGVRTRLEETVTEQSEGTISDGTSVTAPTEEDR